MKDDSVKDDFNETERLNCDNGTAAPKCILIKIAKVTRQCLLGIILHNYNLVPLYNLYSDLDTIT